MPRLLDLVVVLFLTAAPVAIGRNWCTNKPAKRTRAKSKEAKAKAQLAKGRIPGIETGVETGTCKVVFQNNFACPGFPPAIQGELENEMRPGGYNIGINVGRDAGQTVMHCHVHLIPRFVGDVVDPTGGVRNVISRKGSYFSRDPRKQVE